MERVIVAASLGMLLMLSACSAPPDTTPIAQPKVGVYYYPWYSYATHGMKLNIRSNALRGRLSPPQMPELGEYDSRDPLVIAKHLDYTRRGGIGFWAMSWWGPNSPTDITIREHYLKHPRAGEVEFCIHYESPGRLGSFEDPRFDNLIDDFRYFARAFFPEDNYLRIDGRPVVIIYLTRAYFTDPKSHQHIQQLREAIQDEFGFNPFLIGDDYFTANSFSPERSALWDAITSFDVYGMAFKDMGGTPEAVERLREINAGARDLAHRQGVGFVPTISPGYNDTAVREGHVPRPRYLVADGQPQPHGSLFRAQIEQIALPMLDPKADRIVMVNSFNEWYEDTQIEPVSPGRATREDNSGRRQYTDGLLYEPYGNLYLDILAELSEGPD